MNPIIMEALARELASAPREVDPPDPTALGYGTDLSCTTDLAFDFSEVDAQSRQGISETIVRGYITVRGTLPDDASWGYDVRAQLHVGMTVAALNDLAHAMKAQCMKDDRIEDVRLSLSFIEATSTLKAHHLITAADPTLGVFELVLSVTSADVLIETIQGA